MRSRRYGTFTGGIAMPDEKGPVLDELIQPCPPLQRLRVPLATCGGAAARPLVAVGERVSAGDLIAAAADGGVDVFAPASGRVAVITSAQLVCGRSVRTSPAIELADLSPFVALPGESTAGASSASPTGVPNRLFAGASSDEICSRLRDAQLATFRRRPQPLAAWLADARAAKCRTLVLNLMEHEPFVVADHRLLVERPGQVIEGLALLARALGAERTILAADGRRTRCYGPAAEAADRLGIESVALPHKYPMGADIILAKVLTRRETPPGCDTTAVGVAVIDAATCFAAWLWATRGDRMAGRIVTLSGPRIAQPRTCYVPFGADCGELLVAAGAAGGHGIHGGPMAGTPLPAGAVVSPASNLLLAIEPEPAAEPGPCIRCSWCTDHCPSRLNVPALNDAFELSLLERARAAHAEACIGCGVCSYVCPAKLPLTDRVQKLKAWITTPAPGGVISLETFVPAPASANPPAAEPRQAAQNEPGSARDGRKDPRPATAKLSPLPDLPHMGSAPFLRAPEGARAIFIVTILAACAPLVGGLILFGWRAAAVVALSVMSCSLVELIYYRVTRTPSLWGRSHGVLTGLLLGLTLPAFVPWYVPVVAGAFAVIVGKAVFGGVGHFVWQPALVGRLAVAVLLPIPLIVASPPNAGPPALQPVLARGRLLTGDVNRAVVVHGDLRWRYRISPAGADAYLVTPPAEALRGLTDRENPRFSALVYAPQDLPDARPAGLLGLPPMGDVLNGIRPGGIGETSVILIIVAGLYLIYRNFVKWQLPLFMIAAAAGVAAIAPIYLVGANDVVETHWLPIATAEGLGAGFTYVSYQLFSTELLLAAFFFATEMTSRPVAAGSQVLFGIGCGVAGMLMHMYSELPAPFLMGVLLMNTITPTLDRLWRPRVFGTK